MDPAHTPSSDPAGILDDVILILEGGGGDPHGLHLDSHLCLGLADGLREVAEGMALLTTLAETVREAFAPQPPRRTAQARRVLARTAAPLDPQGRVIAFPLIPQTIRENSHGQG